MNTSSMEKKTNFKCLFFRILYFYLFSKIIIIIISFILFLLVCCLIYIYNTNLQLMYTNRALKRKPTAKILRPKFYSKKIYSYSKKIYSYSKKIYSTCSTAKKLKLQFLPITPKTPCVFCLIGFVFCDVQRFVYHNE